jgi:hypothetical protein
MNRGRALLVVVIATALFVAYFESRGAGGGAEAANGGGPGDGARDVTSSHPLPNETATPTPKSSCTTAPGR